MPVSWSIRECIVHLESDEAATFEEWTSAVDAALRDSGFKVGMSVVHDLRRMVRVPSAQEAQARSDFLAAKSRACGVVRWAAVVALGAQFGMARMAEVFSDRPSVTFRAFDSLEDAQRWARGPT